MGHRIRLYRTGFGTKNTSIGQALGHRISINRTGFGFEGRYSEV